MCYYRWMEKLVFFSQETLLNHANLFRHYYGLTACDITGGEPTICKSLFPLTRHCARIGLAPTIITHGQNLTDFHFRRVIGVSLREFEEFLDDYLISLHGGSPASHDAVLCREGSFKALTGNLDGLSRPVRFNTTLMSHNIQDLPVEVLLDRPPTVWNLIAFNPFHKWGTKEEIDFQVRYAEAAPGIAVAVQRLEAAGWEVNVRYFPLCIAEAHGFARNVSGFHQVPYDPWEWRLAVTSRLPLEVIQQAGGWDATERELAKRTTASRRNPTCAGCSREPICDRPQDQYLRRFGEGELIPTPGAPIHDPVWFQR